MVPGIERTRHQNSSLVRDQEYLVEGRTFTGSIECHCRQGIPQENRLERLATEPGGFQESDGSMANEGRPIFQPLERAARNICQLECTAGSVGDECVFIELEINEGLRFPPLFGDSGLFIQDSERESVNSGGHPALDEPAMIPVAAGTLLLCHKNFSPVQEPPQQFSQQ